MSDTIAIVLVGLAAAAGIGIAARALLGIFEDDGSPALLEPLSYAVSRGQLTIEEALDLQASGRLHLLDVSRGGHRLVIAQERPITFEDLHAELPAMAGVLGQAVAHEIADAARLQLITQTSGGVA